MRYENVSEGYFVSRPNRFAACVEIGGREVICHVKNTGRCRELLISGASVFLQKRLPCKKGLDYSAKTCYRLSVRGYRRLLAPVSKVLRRE